MPESETKTLRKKGVLKMAKKEFTFKARSGSEKSTISEPVEGCKASQLVLDVLNMGDLPEGLELRFAKSYGAHFISKKGKNALGFFDTRDQLVINGIADELEKAGVKGIVQPVSSKNYKAIRLGDLEKKDLRKLQTIIARVLGFSGKKAARAKAKPVGKKKRVTNSKSAASSTTEEAKGNAPDVSGAEPDASTA